MIRSGFVSNSSSSSFILKGGTILNSKEEVINNLGKGEIVYIGREMGDGEDVFVLDENIERLIKLYPDRFLKYAPFIKAYLNPNEFRAETFEEMNNREEDSENIVYIDYDSIGNDRGWEDDEYAFIKNYLLSDEEWKAVNDYEWIDIEESNKRPSLLYTIYSERLNKDEFIKREDKSGFVGVVNLLVSEYFYFTPSLYIEVDKLDLNNLPSEIEFYKDFEVHRYGEEIGPINHKFMIDNHYGIIEKIDDPSLLISKGEE